MGTPQFFEIPSTGTYRLTDGTAAYQFTEGDMIPMSLAIALGIEGAAYDAVPVFDAAQVAAIEALIAEGGGGDGGGGGGGGATFPMVEGVWYDQSFGVPSGVDNTEIGADGIAGTVVMIPVDCTISKIGIRPTAVPNDPATVRVGIYALDATGAPAAQVGSTATVTVPGDWSEGTIPEAATSIAIDAGWYFIGAASDVAVSVGSLDAFTAGPGLLGVDAYGGRFIAWEVDYVGAQNGLPSTLTGETMEKETGGPQILFQITHD